MQQIETGGTMKKEKDERSFWEKLATLIVDKRNLFFLLYGAAMLFSVFASGWVSVNDDLTSYLPEETETRRGLDLMDEEFTTFATARVMVNNITYDQALTLSEELEKIEGITEVEFDETEDHYRGAAALFDVTFDGEVDDEISLTALNALKEELAPYDLYVSSEVGNNRSDLLAEEMKMIMVVAAVIIVSVLLLTSKTYMEIPVLLLTFIAAAVLNMGTNFFFGEISFISNSVTVVLQLALAIDYAIILCHRYSEERVHMEPREATITALSKAIPEISASSLTTISGLGALMFMQFGIRQIANYDFFVKYFPDLLGMGSAATLDTMIAIEVVCSAFLIFGFLTRLSVVLPTLSMAVAEWYILDNGLMAGIANMPMGEVALMSSLQLGYVPLLFVGMFVFIMLAGPGKVSVDYLLSLYFTNKDSLNELKNF